jgi:hypothetical protein
VKWSVVWWRERSHIRDREERAAEELRTSRELQREDSEQTRPLRHATQRNMFSDMIRDALEVGYGQHVHAHVAGGRSRGKK